MFKKIFEIILVVSTIWNMVAADSDPVDLVPPNTMPSGQFYSWCAEQMDSIVREGKENSPYVVVPPNVPTGVIAKLIILELKGIDQEEQMLTSTVELQLQWTDLRLRNNVSFCQNNTEWSYIVEATSTLIWFPQWVLENSVDKVLDHQYWDFYPVVLTADGTITWTILMHINTECILDVQLFPYDVQQCQITFAWPAYPTSLLYIDIEDKINPVQLDVPESGSCSLWLLMGQSLVNNTETFPSISFALMFQRKYQYYVGAIVIPLVVVNVMTTIVFVLPPLAPKRQAMGFITLTAVFLFNIGFYDLMPKTSNNIAYINLFFSGHTMGCAAAVGLSFFIVRIAEFREAQEEEEEAKREEKEAKNVKAKMKAEVREAEESWTTGSFLGGCVAPQWVERIKTTKVNNYTLIIYPLMCIGSYIGIMGMLLYNSGAALKTNLSSAGGYNTPVVAAG